MLVFDKLFNDLLTCLFGVLTIIITLGITNCDHFGTKRNF